MSKPLMIKKGTINIDRLSKYFILFVHSTCLKTIKIIYIEKNQKIIIIVHQKNKLEKIFPSNKKKTRKTSS